MCMCVCVCVSDIYCLVSHLPPASKIDMFLIKTFVELGAVAGRSRKRAGSPEVVSRRKCFTEDLRRRTWSVHGMYMAWQL